MRCTECERPYEPGQRFCNGCGTKLTGDPAAAAEPDAEPEPAPDSESAPEPETEPEPQPTELIAVGDDPSWDDPVWAATGSVPTQPSPVQTRPTQPSAVPSSPPPALPDAPPPTDAIPATSATATMPVTAVAPSKPAPVNFRFNIVTLLGAAGALLTLASMFTTVVGVSSNTTLTFDDDTPSGFVLGNLLLADLGTNLPIAGLIAACCMAAGGVAVGFGWRWGGGLAGGGGLAYAGIAAVAIGIAQMPLDAAREYAQIPTETPFTLAITRDIGYWLLIVAAAFGVVLFFASLNEALADKRRDLNPWIAALGALAAVVTVAGPLIPVRLAIVSDNWYLIDGPGEAPAMLVVGRLVQLGLLALAGVVGFLIVRPYGLGLAAGGSLPVLWMGVTVLAELGDSPVGPGWRNPGAQQMELHGVTIIGIAALASLLIVAPIAAYNQAIERTS